MVAVVGCRRRAASWGSSQCKDAKWMPSEQHGGKQALDKGGLRQVDDQGYPKRAFYGLYGHTARTAAVETFVNEEVWSRTYKSEVVPRSVCWHSYHFPKLGQEGVWGIAKRYRAGVPLHRQARLHDGDSREEATRRQPQEESTCVSASSASAISLG